MPCITFEKALHALPDLLKPSPGRTVWFRTNDCLTLTASIACGDPVYRRHAEGRWTVKVLPLPGSLWMDNRPPWRLTNP